MIVKRVRAVLPEVEVAGRAIGTRRAHVVVRSKTASSPGKARIENVTLRFIAPTLDEAKRMYLAVRRDIISSGNEPSVTDGVMCAVVREIGGGAAGYIPHSAMYHYTAAFKLTQS